jgi:PPOX class probable F420-dependent enzyme
LDGFTLGYPDIAVGRTNPQRSADRRRSGQIPGGGVVRENRRMTTFPESHQDLLDADLATLATIGGNGLPQQTVVWFLYEDGQLKLSLNTSRRKTKNLTKRPQCSLLILDPAVDQRFLEVRGTAALEPDADYAFANRVGAKYGGADLSEHDGPGDSRVIVTIEPSNVYAVDVRIGQM